MQNKWAEELMERTTKLVQSIPEDVLHKLSSLQDHIRKKATEVIIKPLDGKNPDDVNVLQTIPICLAQMWDFGAALSFISTLVSHGRYISFETIQMVYNSTLDELENQEVQEDFKFMKQINKHISLLISSTEKVKDYNEDINFLIFVWKELERKWEYKEAILVYEKIIKLKHEDGYLYLGLLYKKLNDFDSAITFFEAGWNFYTSQIYLENIIITLCENWKIEQAKRVYLDLTELNSHTNPFILYSLEIENDQDLWKLVEIMWENINEINSILVPLIQHANNYISHKIWAIENQLKEFIEIGQSNFSQREMDQVTHLIQRKLYLSYVDINILKNNRYLSSHLVDIHTLWFSWDEYKKWILQGFLEKNSEMDVSEELKNIWEEDVSWDIEEILSDEDVELTPFVNSMYFSLNVYLSHILKIHFHWVNYSEISGQLLPLISKCLDELQMLEEWEDQCITVESMVFWEREFIESLPNDIAQLYHELVKNIDEIYGKFFRVFLSQIARNELLSYKEYSNLLSKNPNIACFFFIEQIISKKFIPKDIDDSGEIYKYLTQITEKYWLAEIDTANSILFWELLIREVGPDFAINFLYNGYNVIDDILGLYTILKAMQYLTEEESKNMVIELDDFCSEKFQINSFFQYVEDFIQDGLEQKDITDFEKKYILLSLGISHLVQKQTSDYKQKALNYFVEAIDFWSVEALLEAWHILELNWEYDTALAYYEQALLLHSNINVLSFILGLTISTWKFDIAEKYIDYWIKSGYQMGSYIWALLVRKTKKIESLEQYLILKNKSIDVIDYPEGTIQLYQGILTESINSERKTILWYKEKLLSLYIAYLNDNDHTKIIHMLWIIFQMPNESITEVVNTTFGVILWNSFELSSETNDEISMEYIDYFAYLYYEEFNKYFESFKKSNNTTSMQYTFDLKNEISWLTLGILSKFSHNQKYVNKWKRNLEFTKYAGVEIANEKICSTLTLQ